MSLTDFFKGKKHGIRIIKVYDDVRMNDSIISAPPTQTRATLEDMKAKPKRYAYQVKKEDQLLGVPKIKIAELATPEHLKEHNIDVVAEITYTYTTAVIKPKPNPIYQILWFITIWSIIGGLALMFMLSRMADRTAIDAQCYYYYKEGVPTHLIIEGEEYKLDEEGKLDFIDETFFNPWHREIIEEGACTEIHVGK